MSKHTTTPEGDMLTPEHGLYLYCLLPASVEPDLPATGFDEAHPVFIQTMGAISAMLSRVRLDAFQGPEAEAQLQDISWVGPRAVGHGQVLERIMDFAPVFPAAFGTIFSSLEKLEEKLRLNRDIILNFFQEASGKDEFSVKGYLDLNLLKKTVGADLIQKEEKRLAALSPGKRYFAEKRIRNNAESEISCRLAPLHKEFSEFLNIHTNKSRPRGNLSKKATGRETDMIVNAACLVFRKRYQLFQQKLQELEQRYQQDGLHFEVSGPWPQYSFCPALHTSSQ